MKGMLLMTAVGLTFSLVGLVGSNMALPNECGERLANNRYRYTVKDEAGSPPFEMCLQFVSPGVESAKFDLLVNGISLTAFRSLLTRTYPRRTITLLHRRLSAFDSDPTMESA